jgi:peptidoglycan/LPS O-acetylase OafA/YrhL
MVGEKQNINKKYYFCTQNTVMPNIFTNDIPIDKSNSFNAIRIICCLAVALEHCFSLSGNEFQELSFYKNISLNTFFILSGFFVTRSYLLHFCNVSVFSFFKHRALRIFPSYLCAVLFCAILPYFFCPSTVCQYFLSLTFWKYLFCNILTLNFLCPSPVPLNGGGLFGLPINGALWTIKIEVAFYLALPLIIWGWSRMKTIRSKNIFLAVLYILSVTWDASLNHIGTETGNKFIVLLAHQFPAFISFFVAGGWFALNYRYARHIENRIVIPALLLFIGGHLLHTDVLQPATLTIMILWLGFHTPFLSPIGQNRDLSYEIYLFHCPIIVILAHCGWFAHSFIGGCLSSLAITIPLALVVWHISAKTKKRMKN